MAVSLLSAVSWLFGWIYFLCWSFSFYPQPLLNWRRRSTTGTTIDFPTINLLGFVAYFSSNAAFLYSSTVREEYALRNKGLTPTVQLNDLAFAAHAIVLSAITLSQFLPSLWGFEKRARGAGTIPSKSIQGICVGSFVGVGTVTLIVALRRDVDPVTGWAWIDVIYAVSYVKLVITLVKYMPQVLTNHRNRSTEGWAIGQILLDFVGGILSLLQLGIDSYQQRDWSGITGNPVKLALGQTSIFFDLIFIFQHYWQFRGRTGKEYNEGEQASLLDGSSREDRID